MTSILYPMKRREEKSLEELVDLARLGNPTARERLLERKIFVWTYSELDALNHYLLHKEDPHFLSKDVVFPEREITFSFGLRERITGVLKQYTPIQHDSRQYYEFTLLINERIEKWIFELYAKTFYPRCRIDDFATFTFPEPKIGWERKFERREVCENP